MNGLKPALLTVLALLSGCASLQSTPPTAVHQPMSVRPQPRPEMAPANGGIYQPAFVRPLFEDRRARLLGDTLVINLVERNTATKASDASASRNRRSMPASLRPPRCHSPASPA